MNILSQITTPISYLMNKCSSVFMASGTILGSLFTTDSILSRLVSAVLQMIYFSCKWVLYMIDVIYFYILQLAGVSADTSIFDSPNSDMTFNLLIENKETVTVIIKNLIAIALVLILVTAIIAIIKQQGQALKDKKAKKSPTSDVLRGIFKSVLLIILTPLIAIVGIIASSVLLRSLFNATNLSDTKSLSARVFNASASAANKYKIYAENGVRIPIKYKFSGDNKSEAINYTVQMVGNNKFPSLAYFDENNSFMNSSFNDPILEDTIYSEEKGDSDDTNSIKYNYYGNKYSSGTEAWLNDVYYGYYDTSDSFNAKSKNGDQYRYYSSHVNEYYAMSDVVGYAMDTMEKYYFITIQELLEGVLEESYDSSDGGLFADWIESYKIKLLDRSGTVIENGTSGYLETIEAFKNGSYSCIKYTSNYKGQDYEYYHVKDAVDEMEGAKFVIAFKVETGDTYQESLNGQYYKVNDGGTDVYYEADTYYYKADGASRYKKVDLYYTYNSHKDKYEKVSSIDGSTDYYYKLGENYIKISDDDKDNFFYKDKDRNYQPLAFGSTDTFYNLVTKWHYAPLVNGIEVNNNSVFTSDYVSSRCLITAKGIFDNSSYPTAIKRLTNGNVIFYRDDLEMLSDGSVSDAGTLDQIEAEEDEEEESQDQNIFQKIGSAAKNTWNSVKKFVSGIFNPLKLVPDLKLDASTVSTTYTNKTTIVHELTDGELHLSYFFADSITSSLSKKLYGINLNYLYDPMQINYVILVIGSVIFLKICVTAVFGLISRSLSLLIMIMIYPVACATIPYDEATGASKNGPYAKWSQKYTSLLFSTYGLLLSINFVFLILPIIDKLEFFTAENFQTNKALGRVGNAIYNPWLIIDLFNVGIKNQPNFNLIANYVNKILRIIFQISAFSLIASADGKGGSDTFYAVIQSVVGTGPGALEDSPLDNVKKTLKSMANAVNVVFFPGKHLKNLAEKAKESAKGAKDFLPGSAVLGDFKEGAMQLSKEKEKTKSKDELIKALKGGASKEEVESKLADYKSSYGIK